MRALLLAAFMSSCCAPLSTRYVVTIMPSVSPTHAECVEAAADDWRAKAPGLELHVVRIGLSDVPDRDAIVVLETDDVSPESGWTRRYPGNVSIVTITSDGFSPAIAAHEMGHAFGLHHQDCGVMAPAVTRDQGVECCDVRQFCAAWGRSGGRCECP